MRYEVLGHYSGEEGERYFNRSSRSGVGRSLHSETYFLPYVSMHDAVLDFGCGDGLMLQAMPAQHKVGFEVNPIALGHCRSLGLTVYNSVDELQTDVFDVVLCNHVLEHLPSPLDGLRLMYRVLRPGGKLVLMVPLEDWRTPTSKQHIPDDLDHHLYAWTPRTLGNLLVDAGFQIDEVKIITAAWHPRMFWVARFGKVAWRLACWVLAVALKRRQIQVIASKPVI